MGKELWKDSIDGCFRLEERGCNSVCFKSDVVEMAGQGTLLNYDIPELVGALVRHLSKNVDKGLAKQAVAEALKSISPLDTVDSWRSAIAGDSGEVDLPNLFMLKAIATKLLDEETADALLREYVKNIYFRGNENKEW